MKMRHKASGQIEDVGEQYLEFYRKRGYELVEPVHSLDYPKQEKIKLLIELLRSKIQ